MYIFYNILLFHACSKFRFFIQAGSKFIYETYRRDENKYLAKSIYKKTPFYFLKCIVLYLHCIPINDNNIPAIINTHHSLKRMSYLHNNGAIDFPELRLSEEKRPTHSK